MRNTILIIYSLFFFSCACHYEDIRREGDVLNPTSFVYDFPEMQVRQVLDSCFALPCYNFSPEAREKYKNRLKTFVHLSEELYMEPLVLSFKGSKEKIVPIFMLLKSYVFKNRKGQFLESYAEYILSIDSIAIGKTRISISLHKNYVKIGRKFGFNPISLGLTVDRDMDIPSSTIEEYEILKYVGDKLGQTGMPRIHYPKSLTKEDVLNHFRGHDGKLEFPFTEEDVYGW